MPRRKIEKVAYCKKDVQKAGNNRRILIICPVFRDLELELLGGVERAGYQVDTFFYDEDFFSSTSILNRVAFRLLRKKMPGSLYRVISRLALRDLNLRLMEISSHKSYDTLLVIKGFGLSPHSIDGIAARRRVLYFWDTIDRFEYCKILIDHFDEVFSYSKSDCKKFGWQYLPVFGSYRGRSLVSDSKMMANSFFYFGDYTRFREEELSKVALWCKENEIEYDFTLVSSSIQHTRDSLLKWKNGTIPRQEYKERLKLHRFVVDLSRDGDGNPTQRTSDAIEGGHFLIGDTGGLDLPTLLSVRAEAVLQRRFQEQTIKGYIPIEEWVDTIMDYNFERT